MGIGRGSRIDSHPRSAASRINFLSFEVNQLSYSLYGNVMCVSWGCFSRFFLIKKQPRYWSCSAFTLSFFLIYRCTTLLRVQEKNKPDHGPG